MKKEYLYAGIAILAWGTSATSVKLMQGSLDTVFLLFGVSLTAAVFLCIVCGVQGRFRKLREYSAGTIFRMILIGLVGMFVYNALYMRAVECMPAQQAYMLNYFWPALIVVFSGFLLKEKLTFWKVGAVLVSFAGVLIYSADGNLKSLFTSKAEGVTFALLGAVVYSLYSVLNKRESYDKFLCITIACVTSAACSLVWVLASGQIHLVQTANWGGLIYQGVVCIGTAYLAWAYAMDAGDTAKVSTLSYLTPFVSLIFTCVFLWEKVTAYSAAGIIFVIMGIILQERPWGKKNTAVKA